MSSTRDRLIHAPPESVSLTELLVAIHQKRVRAEAVSELLLALEAKALTTEEVRDELINKLDLARR